MTSARCSDARFSSFFGAALREQARKLRDGHHCRELPARRHTDLEIVLDRFSAPPQIPLRFLRPVQFWQQITQLFASRANTWFLSYHLCGINPMRRAKSWKRGSERRLSNLWSALRFTSPSERSS